MSDLPDTGGRVPVPQDNSRTVLLDEGGEQLSSLEFAKLLETWRDGGVRETRFCLGTADGFTPEERAGADQVIAFGPAPWPQTRKDVGWGKSVSGPEEHGGPRTM